MVIQLLVSRDDAADARAAGREALGDRVDDNYVILIALKLEKAHELFAAVDELAIHLVADDEQVVLLGDVGHELQLLLGEDGAGRIAGVCEQYRAGVLVDACLDALAHGELIALLGLCGHGADSRAGEGDKGRVVGVKRLGNNDLIALVKDAGERYLERFRAAGRDEHLLIGYRSIYLAVVIDNGIDHLGNAVGRSIRQNRLREILHGFKVRLGSRYIGLADVQMINLFALLDSLGGVGRELSHRGKAAFFDLA